MPPAAPIDADEVHVLDAGQTPGPRRGLLLILVVLGVVAATGTWIVISDPFTAAADRRAPPPSADNLLGAAWSFESTADRSPGEFWTTPAEAPAGFSFSAAAAVSGAVAARAQPNLAGWSQMVSQQSWRLDSRGQIVELGAVSSAPGVQLLLRFEQPGGATLETVVASGAGALLGQASAPPGFDRVRVVIGCLGEGSLDDVVLRLLPRPSGERPLRKIGVFDIFVGDPRALSVFRGQDLVLRVDPLALGSSSARALPGTVAQLPGEQALAFSDGTRVAVVTEVRAEAQGLVLSQQLSGLPGQSRLVRSVLVSGSLATAPVSVRSSRGYEPFVDDIEMQGVDALLLGHTQDRLGLSASRPFDLSVKHRADGTVLLTIERSAAGDVSEQLTIQASFQDERVRAAGLADAARAAEDRGALGQALASWQQIVEELPFDERLLATATVDRGRLTTAMRGQLERLQEDLDDALFLGSAQRCEELRDEALTWARTYAGSEGEEQFEAQARAVASAGAALIAEQEGRRRGRMEALLRSFEENGSFPDVCQEFRAELALLRQDSALPEELLQPQLEREAGAPIEAEDAR